MPSQLSLCMIVRDNENILSACLTSIRPWVDEIVVVDTGSVDGTPEIARSLGAKVFFFPWCNSFAAARNESLKHATGDWLFWMDSDDTITAANGERLRRLAQAQHPDRLLGHVMQVHCLGADGDEVTTVVDHVKLIRNHPDIRFEGRIHEQVLPAIRRLGGEVGWTDVFVVHSGADHSPNARRRKLTRDLHLLELELIDHPDHPFCLFNFGMTYLDMGEPRRAAEYLRRCLAVTQPGESHLRKAYALLLSSLGQAHAWDEALPVVEQAAAHFPDDPEIAFRQGMVFHALGRLPDAIQAYRRALETPKQRFFCSVDPGIGGFKARHNLGIAYQDHGQLNRAELQWRLVAQERPNHQPSLIALGDVLVRQGKLTTAEILSGAWCSDATTLAAGLLLQVEVYAARGEHANALKRLEEGLKQYPEMVLLRQVYCQRLFEAGRYAEARAALEDLVQRQPQDGAAYHNLGLALLQLNESAAAAEAFERSLALRPGHIPTEEHLRRLRHRPRNPDNQRALMEAR